MKNTSHFALPSVIHPLVHYFSYPLGILSDRIHELQRKLFFDAWSISNEAFADEPMRVLFIGKQETDKNYFRRLIFNERCHEKRLGRIGSWRLCALLLGLHRRYDLVIFKSRMTFCNRLKSRSRFVIPDWISCEIDLCCDLEARSRSKKTLKQNLKKLQRGNFGYFVTRDPDHFRHFYYQMHRPYIDQRHGRTAVHFSFEKIRSSFDSGELLVVTENGKAVAGVVIDYRMMDGIPRITQLGVLNGQFDYVKRGALIALYYFTIHHLKENEHARFSLGSTRPFFSDGVLHHKLNWGATIVCESTQAFLLSFSSKKKCLKSFLAENPFIIHENNRLSLATFAESRSGRCPYLPKDENSLKLHGLNRIASFSL